MKRRLTLSWLWIDSLPASQTSSVEDLNLFSTLQALFLRNLADLLERYNLALVELGNRVVDIVNSLWLAAFRRVSLLNPLAEVVQDVYIGMAERLQSPANTRSGEDTQLLAVVDYHTVVPSNAELTHGSGEVLCRRQHMRVRR